MCLMLIDQIETTLLYRCLSEKKWRDLPATAFALKYEEEVSDVDSLVIAVHVTNFGNVYELPDGLVALEGTNGKWSLYENETRARDRDHKRAWAEFIRGRWSSRVPTEPGLYFVKDNDLGKRSVRKLEIVNGRLKDTSGGMVRPGLVSEWVGQWWLPAIPGLPGSY